MPSLILGLDSSTQSLSAVVIDKDERRIVHETGMQFSDRFPHYNTVDGVLRDDDPTLVHAPPLMWVEALDQLLLSLADTINLADVVAIAGSGQQHGSVYLKSGMNDCLATLDPKQALHLQLREQFARATAPIWMDASTADECQRLTDDLGGSDVLCQHTGSVAVERFTGPQIKKFAEQEPAAYAETAHICLVSSFICSLLAGRIVGIDYADATGMNLFDLRQRDWHAAALDSCGAGLADKLQSAIDPCRFVGAVSPYMQQRYGFHAGCQVLPFSGDNPCSLIGLGLIDEDMTAISLGTSDTLFGHMTALPAQMSPCAHTFIAPTNHYMLLLCFKNGSLAREAVRRDCGLDWEGFSAAVDSTEPGNNGGFMLPWFETEIVPRVMQPGVHLHGMKADDHNAMCRGVVEAQMLSMNIHAAEAGLQPGSIRVTGGASQNRSILQVMADVFQCPVDVLEISNGAALGAALRALQASEQCSWDAAVADFTAVDERRRVMPRTACADVYASLAAQYAAAERAALSVV